MSFVESAMHLADPSKKTPEGIDQYVPKKAKGKKQEKSKQEGAAMGANHTHEDCGLHLDHRNYRKHNDRNKAGEELQSYRESVTPAEVMQEFGLNAPVFASLCRNGLFHTIVA